MTDCQIYLTLPDLPDADLAWIPDLLAGRPVAALRLATTDTARAGHQIETLRARVQALDIALILTDLPDLARARDCDGAEVAPRAIPTPQARRALGADRQLGVPCGISRDQAMRAGEDGADYVSFAGTPQTVADLVGWWVGIAELPVVAMLESADAVPAARAAGADFIGFTLPETADTARTVLDAICNAVMS